MKINVVARKMIKPCTPTPATLKSYKVDFSDLGPSTEQLVELLPRRSYEVDEATDPMLSVQTTEFRGGVVVIGISLSHRISDASSLATFVAAFSNATNSGSGKATITPSFDESPAFFPGKKWNNPLAGASREEEIVVKRLCFDAETIKSTNLREHVFSKVLVVSALIAKALMQLDRAKHGRSRDCFINHPVNMRGRTVPSLHKHACGNLILQSLTRCISAAETAEMGIRELVDLMRDSIGKSVSGCGEVVSRGSDGVHELTLKPAVNALPRVLSHEAHVLWMTDWSKFGIYEADFGWGKPAWAGVAPLHAATTVLIENKNGDGIEAWVHLHKDDMLLFEQDEEISRFNVI